VLLANNANTLMHHDLSPVFFREHRTRRTNRP
jgi:hypothetical protein